MKKIREYVLLFGLVFSLTACGAACIEDGNRLRTEDDTPNTEDGITNTEDDNSNSFLVEDGETIRSVFEVDLSGDEITFLTVEVTEDMEATVHYSYTTREKEGAVWGYYLSGSEDKSTFELQAGTENVYGMFWTDKSIELKQGTNIFFISGDDISCKMCFEIAKIDKAKVSYVGTYTREEAQEKLKEIWDGCEW